MAGAATLTVAARLGFGPAAAPTSAWGQVVASQARCRRVAFASLGQRRCRPADGRLAAWQSPPQPC
eukprot:2580287-Alexandrium_andersonii.AAC.1